MAIISGSRIAHQALIAGMVTLAATPVLADDLREALVMAYNTNPTLQAARAQQRAIDEGVPIARAAGLPSVSGTAAYSEFLDGSSGNPLAPKRNLDASVNLGMPVYAGGGIRNSLNAARTRVSAGQADLRGVESGLFSQVVSAYMDVILAEAVVKLNRANVQRLEVNLQATRDRFEIGDLTRTDVAQSASRLALAQGQTRSAEANLIAARERYIQIVGKAPHALAAPPALQGLPGSADEAVAIALDANPDLLAARERSKAAGFDTAATNAKRLPQVAVFASSGYNDFLGSNQIPGAVQSTTDTTVGVRATVPFFQGGLPAAQKRQAQARENAVLEQEIGIERTVIASVRSAYAQWQAAQSLTVSSQTAVDAAILSLEGVRAENTVGNRTILDILNAENELLNAQVQLVTAKRNAYVAGFNLLAAMGKAEARDLGLDGGPLYDPEVNARRARNSIWDWDDNPAPKPVSTRTVDSTAQDGSVTRGLIPSRNGTIWGTSMRQVGEPSVEEILDSIKKVIARDNHADTGPQVRRRDAAPTIRDEEDDILDLGTAGEMVEDGVCADDPLLPRETVSSISESLAALAIMAEPRAAPQIVRSGETSLEGLARELLRPALAEWLEKNLPPLVEKMVAAEIARIVGKRG